MSVELRAGRSGPAALFAGALYRSAPAGSLVEVRFRLGEGMGQRFVEVERLDRLIGTVLSLASRTDVYVAWFRVGVQAAAAEISSSAPGSSGSTAIAARRSRRCDASGRCQGSWLARVRIKTVMPIGFWTIRSSLT